MRELMIEQMGALAAQIVAANRTADDLTRAADKLHGDPLTDVLSEQARRQRVEVLALQGKLAGLTNDFVERFGAM